MMGREALMRKLNQVVPEADKQLADAQLDAAKDLAGKISARAPTDSGEYKASIEGGRLADRPGQASILGGRATKDKNATGVFAAWYWRFLEFGTSAHIIRAKNAPALRFRGRGGQMVSKESVAHPGSAAQPHVFPTWRAFRKTARRQVAKAVNKAVRTAMGK